MTRVRRIRSAAAFLLIGVIAAGLRGAEPPRLAGANGRAPATACRFLPRTRLGSIRFQHGSSITSLQLSTDGKALVSVDYHLPPDSGTLESGREIGTLPKLQLDRAEAAGSAQLPNAPAARGFGLPYSPGPRLFPLSIALDGQTAAVIVGSRVQLWDMVARKPLHRLTSKDAIGGFLEMAFTPDGKRLAALSQVLNPAEEAIPAIFIWNVATGREEPRLLFPSPGPNEPLIVESFQFSPDGSYLAASGNGNVYLSRLAHTQMDSGGSAAQYIRNSSRILPGRQNAGPDNNRGTIRANRSNSPTDKTTHGSAH